MVLNSIQFNFISFLFVNGSQFNSIQFYFILLPPPTPLSHRGIFFAVCLSAQYNDASPPPPPPIRRGRRGQKGSWAPFQKGLRLIAN